MVTTVEDLAAAVPDGWHHATHHRFLEGVADGTLPAPAFDRWLEQDHRFVEGLARAWARTLVGAPAGDLGLLADGIAAFAAELAWFDELAAARGLRLPAARTRAAAAYDAHLQRVAAGPHAVALATYWAVEAAYLAAWRTASPGAPAYRPFVEHWTEAAFAAFVDRLRGAADRALAAAPPADVAAARHAVARTLGHEAAFWAMAWEAGGAR